MASGHTNDRQAEPIHHADDGEKGGHTTRSTGSKVTLDRRSYLKLAGGGLAASGGLPAISSRASGRTERDGGTSDRLSDTRLRCGPSEVAGSDRSGIPTDEPVIGANLNGRPRLLRDNLELLEASNTTWVRAFLDIRKKNSSGVRLENDPDIVALREVAREKDCKLIVSLKWDFKASWGDKDPLDVPRPGSEYEADLCECVTRCLESIGAPVDIVILGNEPMWETRSEDIKVDEPQVVEFTRTVKDHLVENGDHGDPSYLVGSFNRTHSSVTRSLQFRQFHREMFDMVRTDDDIDGIDLHVHYDEISQAETALSVAREEVPDGIITVTEFSPVWRYDRYTDTPIGEFEAGRRFARENDLSTDMTAVEYFQYAKRNPRPPEEIGEFYEAMPWYNVDHIDDVYQLFDEYDVSVGTIGFLQGLGMRNTDWTSGWSPFHINFLYQPALMETDGDFENTAHPHYIRSYREKASREETRPAEDKRGSRQSERRLASYLRRVRQRYLDSIVRPES